jgi:excisionase family DNA binding protein
MKNTEEFYTAEELAEKLRVNIMTIYRYIKAGKIKAYKFGKEFRVEKSEFESFLKKLVLNNICHYQKS